MGVGIGPGIGGTAQPPQIRESETTAFVENMKKTVLAMLPADTYEVIPWTQREHDEVFKYRSEAGRPMLAPLMFLRTSLGNEISEERNWQSFYAALLDAFPPEIKERMASEMAKPFAERDTDYVALNYLLSATAKSIEWLLSATQPLEPGSAAAAHLMLNIALPYVAMRGALVQTEAVLLSATQWIRAEGPNHAGFDAITTYLSEVGKIVAEFNVLRGFIETGQEAPEVRNRLAQIAEQLERLNVSFQTLAPKSELHVLGASVAALGTLASAWALSSGTPSLLIGSEMALTGIANGDSALGILGGPLDKILDGVVTGLFSAFISGPQAEAQELSALHDELAALSE